MLAQQIARLNKTVLYHQEKLRENEDALSTKQSEHALLQVAFRDLTDKGFTPTPSLVQTPPQSDHAWGEEGEAFDEEGAPDVPMEPTSSGSGVAGDAARPVAGTAKKRRCHRSADVLNEIVERERSSQSPWRMRYASKLCLHNVLNRQKIQKKELLSRWRMNGTLCFWDRKGNSCDEGWVLVTKKVSKQNFFYKDFSDSVFEPFSSQQLIGAAASFKDLSSRCIQHESLNSSRSGVAGFRALPVRCALGVENTSNGLCDTLLHKATSQEEHVFGATVAAGLMTDTDLDVGSQRVPCDTPASAGLRSSFSGNRADGRPSLCSSEYAGGFRVAGGAGGAETALATAVERRINGLLEVTEPDAGCAANAASAAVAWAAAGESKKVIELHEVHESEVLDAQAQKL